MFNKFFFRLSMHALVAQIQPDKVVRWYTDGDFFASFLHPVFPASHVQLISDLLSKFALRPHHMSRSMVEIHSVTADFR